VTYSGIEVAAILNVLYTITVVKKLAKMSVKNDSSGSVED